MLGVRGSLCLSLLPVLAFAPGPPQRLEPSHLEAIHAQRVEWMKRRMVLPPIGTYQDFRAALDVASDDPAELLRAAKDAEVRVVASSRTEMRDGVLFLGDAARDAELPRFPEEAAGLPPLENPKERKRIESQ